MGLDGMHGIVVYLDVGDVGVCQLAMEHHCHCRAHCHYCHKPNQDLSCHGVFQSLMRASHPQTMVARRTERVHRCRGQRDNGFVRGGGLVGLKRLCNKYFGYLFCIAVWYL